MAFWSVLKSAYDVLEKIFGKKVTIYIALISIGAYGYFYMTNFFVTSTELKKELQQVSMKAQRGDAMQRLDLLYLRRMMLEKDLLLAEDKSIKSPKWKNRLVSMQKEIELVNSEITVLKLKVIEEEKNEKLK